MGGPGSPAAALRSLALLALPGALLLDKYSQYRHRHMESARRRLTERELLTLNTKIDKLLNTLEEGEPELATSQEDECVICVNAKATMQTSPCGHRVVCRRCFVKTIQMAVSQRLLPLRCVICRAKILRLRHTAAGGGGAGGGRLVSSRSWQGSRAAPGPRSLPASASCYSVGARCVPASASLYSVTSGESSLSGVSSVSSGSGVSSAAGAGHGGCYGKLCGGACHGAVPRVSPAAPTSRHRSAAAPASSSLRRTQRHTSKDYAPLASYTGAIVAAGGGDGGAEGGRLPPIREFQREFRDGQRDNGATRAPAAGGGGCGPGTGGAADPPPTAASASSRIRCAQKIVSQLEGSPQKKTRSLFRTPLRALENGARGSAAAVAAAAEAADKAARREEKKAAAERRRAEAAEEAERKREEKARQKAEKEARRQAKEEERRAKQRARDEERRAKQTARELKNKAKKDAKKAVDRV